MEEAQNDSKAFFVSAHKCWLCAENSHCTPLPWLVTAWKLLLHRDCSYWDKLHFVQLYIIILPPRLSVLIILFLLSQLYTLACWALGGTVASPSENPDYLTPAFLDLSFLHSLTSSGGFCSLAEPGNLSKFIHCWVHIHSQTFSSCLSSLGFSSLNLSHCVPERLSLWLTSKRYLSPDWVLVE